MLHKLWDVCWGIKSVLFSPFEPLQATNPLAWPVLTGDIEVKQGLLHVHFAVLCELALRLNLSACFLTDVLLEAGWVLLLFSDRLIV